MTTKSKPIAETLQQRGQQYGSFAVNASISQGLKDIARNSPAWWKLDSYQREAIEMNLHKLSRILTGDPKYVDSWRDIVGYHQLVVDELRQDELATDAVVTIVKASAK